MNNKIKNKKTIAYGAGILLFVTLAVIVAFFPFKSESDILPSTVVFNNVDFQSKNAGVNGTKIDYENKNKEYLKKL